MLAALILFLPEKGFSQFDKKLWNRYFDGDPAGVGADWQKGGDWGLSRRPFEYKTWIKGYRECADQVDDLLKNISGYESAYGKKDFPAAEGYFSLIQKALSEPKSCQKTLVRAYAAGITAMGPPSEASLSLRNEVILFTIFLANLDVVEMLTPERRISLAEGKKSLWTEVKDGDYLLMGAFDCQTTKILLSSTLRPFNAAASLHHEMNHFYEDKRGYEHLESWKTTKNIRTFIYLDEFLASFQGAFFQRRLNLLSKKNYSQQTTDFNLYRPDGVLPHMMGDIPAQAPFPTDQLFNLGYGFSASTDEMVSPLCEIQKLIMGGYFLGAKGPCDQGLLFPERDGSPESQFEMYLFFELIYMRINPELFPKLMGEFERFERAIQSPSPICEVTIKAFKNGELDDYVGKSLGIRPGNTGVKPCLRVTY
jgi:hypothetical protein